jgi:nucleotide-binding universal stress UspA family protein
MTPATTPTEPRPLRVLLATDGSPDARNAAEWLARFPLARGSRILVLSAVAIPPSPITFPGLEDLQRSLLAEGRRGCDEAADLLRSRWPAIEVSVVDGDPREQILRAADTWKPDLAVLGRRGLGGLERLVLGSVSLTAARHLSCSVLIPHGSPRSVRRVVVGVDGSEPSRRAVDFVAALAVEPDVEVDVVAVAESLPVASSLPFAAREAFRSLTAEVDEQQHARLRDVLARATRGLSERARVHTHTLVGDPARQLLERAATADLLVVGSRGLGAVRRLLLGTVSEKVLQHAPCPVLIVKESGPPAG